MMDGNGHEEVRKKKCPLLGEWCIEEGCALFTKITRIMGAQRMVDGVCAFNTLHILLSEINQKTAPPKQQTIQLPHNLRRG